MKDMQDLHIVDYKSLLREIKSDLNKHRDIPHGLEIPTLLKFNFTQPYRVNEIPIITPPVF